MVTNIHSSEELDKWLAGNYYFEDGHVLSVSENPIEIIIGYNIVGNYEANSEREILQFRLKPSNILEWSFNKETILTGDENYIESIDAVKTEQGICLEFSTPLLFRLRADNLVIEQLEPIQTTFKPHVNENEVYVTADQSEIPKPEFWKEKLRSFGHEVEFRYYGGDARQPDQVPYPDYQGYYIQLPERISLTEEGIFLKHLNVENGKLIVNFENKDAGLKKIWEDLTIILSDLTNAIINSGNCKFTGTEWKSNLASWK